MSDAIDPRTEGPEVKTSESQPIAIQPAPSLCCGETRSGRGGPEKENLLGEKPGGGIRPWPGWSASTASELSGRIGLVAAELSRPSVDVDSAAVLEAELDRLWSELRAFARFRESVVVAAEEERKSNG